MRCTNGDLAATKSPGPVLDGHVVMSYRFRNIEGISAADAFSHVTAALFLLRRRVRGRCACGIGGVLQVSTARGPTFAAHRWA